MKMGVLRLTFFGDSICVGQGVSIYRGWITRIAESLDSYVKDKCFDVLVTNSSVNGRTTRQALEDMPYHVQGSGVDLLVVQFGLNDCNYWISDRGEPRVSIEAFVSNIKEIYHRAKRFGAEHIILNTNHPTARDQEIMEYSGISYQQSNVNYNQALRSNFLSFAPDLELIDIEAYFEALSDKVQLRSLLLSDQLHLSEKGHDEYYRILYPIILERVNSIARGRGWINE